MTKRLCSTLFVVTVLLSLAGWSQAMASIILFDVQGVCTEGLSIDGESAGWVDIRTESENDPGGRHQISLLRMVSVSEIHW